MHEVKDKLDRIFKKITKKPLRSLEKQFIKGFTQPVNPPVFILGLPRSGTTLLYQYIVHRLYVSYFTNGVDRRPYASAIITWLRYKWFGEYTSDFTSRYGKVLGYNSPHEAGGFWGQFFGLHDYVKYPDVTKDDTNKMRQTIAAVENIFGGCPFVNKNVKHMLRLDALSKIFPSSFFIVVERNLDNVALSIIRGRNKLLDNPENWWSVRPPDYGSLKNLEKYEQVAHQVLSLQSKLKEDIQNIDSQRIIRIQYAEFCNQPEGIINILKKKCTGISEKNKAVKSFTESRNTPENKEESLLVEYLHNG